MLQYYQRLTSKLMPAGHSGILLFLLSLFALTLSFRHAAPHTTLVLLLLYLFVTGSLRWQSFPGMLAIMAFIGWQLLSNFIGPFPGQMLESSGTTISWLIIPILLSTLSNEKSWYRFMQCWSIGIVLACGLAVLQAIIGLDDNLAPWRISTAGEQWDRVVGFQSRPWVFSYLGAIAAILFASMINDEKWWKHAYVRYALLLSAVFCMVLAQIRAPMIALLVAFMHLLSGNFQKIGLKKLLLAAIILSALFILSALMRDNMFQGLGSFNGRIPIWQATLEVLQNNPLWGVGRSHFQGFYMEAWDVVHNDPKNWLRTIGHPHSDYLSLAVYYGLPALLAYLGFLLSLVRWAWNIRLVDPKTSRTMAAVLSFVIIAGIAENYIDFGITFYAMLTAYIMLYKRHQLHMQSIESDTNSG